MRRTLYRWLHAAVDIPTGSERRLAIVRRAVVTLAVVLLFAEASVAIRFSGSMGLVMMASTAGLSTFVYGGLNALTARRSKSEAGEQTLVDSTTGLPARAQLLDTLARDIARCERYSHSLTLTVVRISQYEELKASWGSATARHAVDHVAETLRRITRASDFVSRLDESAFAVVLLHCSGRQAALYADRLSLAVSNRPLKSASRVKVPLYVGVEVNPLEYDATRFRGPLEFLSLAGGDVVAHRSRGASPRNPLAADAQGLRQQLMRDYYPGGEMKDFAEAYQEARNRNRHAG